MGDGSDGSMEGVVIERVALVVVLIDLVLCLLVFLFEADDVENELDG